MLELGLCVFALFCCRQLVFAWQTQTYCPDTNTLCYYLCRHPLLCGTLSLTYLYVLLWTATT